MVGHIDMSKLWGDKFDALPETPGPRMARTDVLELAYRNSHYRYFYRFIDEGTSYDVLEIHGSTVVKETERMVFYHYRPIHFFKYFMPKAAAK
jgi:hypothetical protein